MTFGDVISLARVITGWLFNTFGIMWVAVLFILLLRLFDVLGGKPFEALFEFRGLLNTEYYPSLWARYHDPDYNRYMEEREQAYYNYQEYLHRAIREQGRETWKAMRWAKRRYCYQILYNLERDIDGEDDFIKGGYLHHDLKDIIFRK